MEINNKQLSEIPFSLDEITEIIDCNVNTLEGAFYILKNLSLYFQGDSLKEARKILNKGWENLDEDLD
ncbi:MAG: hypothetical protein GF311_28250 [Candidatus Lokiarchaeota archaeon]|nr:hypothetical protein [Candidatus Lokiarchaeota archaeon]